MYLYAQFPFAEVHLCYLWESTRAKLRVYNFTTVWKV